MKEMSLTEHLEELRTRVIRIALILLVGFMVTYSQGELLQDLLLAPLREALGEEGKVVFIGLLDKVLTQFQLSFWASIIFTSPLWFFELWLFIRPGLYDKEAKIVRPFAFIGFLLFVAGVLFGYFIVFPYTFDTILSFGVSNIEATLSLKDYIVLSTKVLVFLGVLFQLPNLILIITFIDLIDRKTLSEFRPYIVTAFAVLSAMLTPPDPITMMALLIPLVALFELGLIGARVFVEPFKAKQEKELAQ